MQSPARQWRAIHIYATWILVPRWRFLQEQYGAHESDRGRTGTSTLRQLPPLMLDAAVDELLVDVGRLFCELQQMIAKTSKVLGVCVFAAYWDVQTPHSLQGPQKRRPSQARRLSRRDATRA